METKENNNILIIYLLIAVSLFLTIFIIPNYFPDYIKMANIIIWIIISWFSIKVVNQHNRFKAKNEKIKTVIIILIIYYILYFLSGLIFGYQNSPYSQSFFAIVKNLFFILVLSMLQEYVRFKLVNSTKSFNMIAIITLVFIVFNLDFKNILQNLNTNEEIFKYLSSIIFPMCIEQCLLTYFAITGGYQLVSIYKVPVVLINILSPIFPDLDWFIITTIKSILTLLLFVFINYEHEIKVKRYTRRELRKNKPINNIPFVIFVLIIVAFVSGLFPYKPLAIMSNSMYPDIKRGDIVVIKDIKDDEYESIVQGEVIAYQLENNIVIHRVIEVGKDSEGKIILTTKGDNNATNDSKQVTQEQIIGRAKFIAKYIGYPSVWFSENILSSKSSIDT